MKESPSDAYSGEELRFFGAVMAAMTHELKNVLAVINESAGLMDDLSRLAARGAPLDPGRLAMLSEAMLRQVRRGDAMLSHLNWFAHSADTPKKSLDLAAAAVCMAGLCQRSAAMKSVCLEVATGQTVTAVTDPYRFARLVYLCLAYAFDNACPAMTVRLSAATTPAGPALTVAGVSPAGPLPAALAEAADSLGAKVTLDEKTGELTVTLPGQAA